METLYTVLITLGVGALAYAFAGVIRLSRRVGDLELIGMEIIDLETRFEKQLEIEIRDRNGESKMMNHRLDEYAQESERVLDTRLDRVWNEIHTLDKVVNPNKDLVK